MPKDSDGGRKAKHMLGDHYQTRVTQPNHGGGTLNYQQGRGTAVILFGRGPGTSGDPLKTDKGDPP